MTPDTTRRADESTGPVPSFSLARQNADLKADLLKAVEEVIDGGHFILGENVAALENEIASLCGVAYGVGVANGSDALHLALIACGVGPGDEVIVPPFTFFATAGAVVRAGARPVFCDVDPATFNIDASKVESCVTSRTKAIIPVHLYGQPADMDEINVVARRHGLYVIEDAAQAIGAEYKGRPVGSLGDLACISFFPTKNLGAFGDGGMVVTNRPELAERVRISRTHGARKKYHHEVFGYNSRLDELQAAVLRVKLRRLPGWTTRRREIARAYQEKLAGLPATVSGALRLPIQKHDRQHVYHQFTIGVANRSRLQDFLTQNGIGFAVYYPLALHLQPVFSDLGYRPGDFPVAERLTAELLSLPMFPEMTGGEIDRVVGAIGDFRA